MRTLAGAILALCLSASLLGAAWGAGLREGMPVIRGFYLGMPIKEVMELAKFRLELQLLREEEGYYTFGLLADKGWRAFSDLRTRSMTDDLLVQTDRSGKVSAFWMSSTLCRRLLPQAERVSLQQFVSQFAAEYHLPPWSFSGEWRGYGWYAFEQPRLYSMKIDTLWRFWMALSTPEATDK
ncbi:hypothetical protein [Candidatus Magnetaquicoccus inordinatus]|uniref:hypothetical protein n=1 Tax=Candidatus Magnetaquicoccus inordinatus TaxID=2496818 RepID=UPI00102B737A|nr:hypothetical protein [Candidatus Magnetaquicoccus inordinatus]